MTFGSAWKLRLPVHILVGSCLYLLWLWLWLLLLLAGDGWTSGKESGQVWCLLCLLHLLRFKQKWHSREYHLTRLGGEEGGAGQTPRRGRRVEEKKKKESGGYESKQRRGMTFSIRQRQFYAITSGCRKERRERPVTERETQGGEKDKTSREICLPDSRRKKCAPAAGR